MQASYEEMYQLNSAGRASPAWKTPPNASVRSTDYRRPSRTSGYQKPVHPMRQIPMAWLSLFLTIVFLILTVLYASQSTTALRERIVKSSGSYAIFVLRALSEVTGILLAVTVAAAFERVQWLLIAGKRGAWLTDYLALQAGTGVMGLLVLATARGVSRVTTRLWSVIRLVVIVLIPVSGVLIMSNVRMQLGFSKVSSVTTPLGFGMGPPNATIAGQLAILTDVLFGAGFTLFLQDSNHAVDITPAARRQKSCSQGIDVRGGQTCEQVVFLVGGLDQVATDVATVATSPEAEAWLAEGHQGYVLSFSECNRNWEFQNETDCRVYHTELAGLTMGAIMICIKNIEPNKLQARIVSCPYTDPINQNCLDDTSWQVEPGWSTSLETTYRRASIAYSRYNATILSHTFTEQVGRPAAVDSSVLLQAWDNFLGNGDDDLMRQVLEVFGLGYGRYLFPAMVGSFLNGVSALAADNPTTDTRGVNALQALLAIPLYWCQTGATERLAMPGLPSSTLIGQGDALNITGGVERNSKLYLAVVRNDVFVGWATLVAYIALTAATLVLCFGALCIGSLTRRAKDIPSTTSFPALDFTTNCVVRSPDGTSTSRGPFNVVDEDRAIEKMKLAKEMRVERAQFGAY